MLRDVFTKSLRDQRWSLLGWSIGVVLLVVVEAAVWPTMRDMQNLDELLKGYPDAMKSLFDLGAMSVPLIIGQVTWVRHAPQPCDPLWRSGPGAGRRGPRPGSTQGHRAVCTTREVARPPVCPPVILVRVGSPRSSCVPLNPTWLTPSWERFRPECTTTRMNR
jgi:hypothetical protein